MTDSDAVVDERRASSRCAASRSSSRASRPSTASTSPSARGEIHSLHGRERRGQVHPDQGPHRRVPDRRRHHHGRRRVRASSAAPPTRRPPASSTVYQEVNLCTNLSVGENVMLGHEVRGAGGIDWRATHRAAAAPPRRTSASTSTPRSALVEPLDRGPAARRDQPRDGHRLPACSCSTSPPRASTAARSSSCSPSCATCATAASRSSSSRTSSTRSTRSPTACTVLRNGRLVGRVPGRRA